MKNSPLFFLLMLPLFFLPLSENILLAQEYQKDWFENPNRTNYLVSPTGFGLKKGEAIYQNGYLFYNSIGYGFTDHLSVNTGVLLLGVLDGRNDNVNGFITTLNPKWTIPLAKNVHVGVAGSLLFSISPNQFDTAGAIYGIGTYGNANNNVSVGFGSGFDPNGWSKDPVMIISGQFRIIKNISIISENWFHPFTNAPNLPTFSLGLRLMGKKMAFDLAYIQFPGLNFSGDPRDTINSLPFISFMIPFGKR